MTIKKLCGLLLICSLGLTAVFARGKQDVAPPRASEKNSIKGGNGAAADNFTFGAVIDEASYNALPRQTRVIGPLSGGARSPGSNDPLPKAFSLKQYAPIPGQQDRNDCTAWAAAYAAKTIMESIKLERTNRFLTTRNAYSPLYCYRMALKVDEKPEGTGANLTTIVSMMKNFGVPKNLEYIKSDGSVSDKAVTLNSETDNLRKWRITASDALFNMYYEKVINGDYSPDVMSYRTNLIKSNISQGNPVIVAIMPSDSFTGLTGEQWKPGPNERPNLDNGHAVCVVGYDDNKFGGAFEIMNSWSEFWGNGGFAWIDYQTFGKYLVQGIVLVDNYSSYEKPFEWASGITIQSEGSNRNVPVRLSQDGVYTSRTSLITGTRLRFVINGNNTIDSGPVYPYIFYTDKALGKTVQVWPPAGNVSTVKIEDGKPLTIPSDNQWITTDGAVKAENFVFLFSRKELDLTAVRNSFEKKNGAAIDRLGAAVGEGRFIQAAYGLYEFSSINNIIDFLDMDSVMGLVFSTQYDKDGKTPLDMVRISGGSFSMGTSKSDPYFEDDEKQRTVRVSNFYIGSAQVTVGEFKEFIASANYRTSAEKNGLSLILNRKENEFKMAPKYNWTNPSYTQEDTFPVVHISWYDAMEYCNWRSKQEGFKPVYTISGTQVSMDKNADGYRLPAEAEWEYACRAGTTTPYNTGGNTISPVVANYRAAYNFKPVPVKSYSPNRWGLYDMHGNVYEWTQDFYENTTEVSIRGGSWWNSDRAVRSAFRDSVEQDATFVVLGFRLVRSAN